MDKSVPPGAAILLDFIGKTEVGTDGPDGYRVIYGHKQSKLAKPVTEMTLDEIQHEQRKWSKNHGSSATGRYQFMRATLRGLISELGLRGSQKLDADLQDRLGYHLLKRRGYEDFMSGKIGRAEFGKRLAQEWASFPVLAPTKGAHRSLSRGQSYYAGDALNKALVSPAAVEQVLNRVKTAAQKPTSKREPSPSVPLPGKGETPSAGKGGGPVAIAATAILASLAAAWAWLADLPCNVLGTMCG